MNREIISEINRMREIMGLSLIVEATGNPLSQWAKKFFSEILSGTIDELPTQQLISRTLKSTVSQIDDADIQEVINAIRRGDWGNEALRFLDPKTLYRQLISTLPTNQALEVVRGSIRKIFKEEYPEFDKLANTVEKSLKYLNPITAQNKKTYNELLDEFKSLKKSIEDSDLSSEFKTMTIDAYQLNQLPKSADEAVYNARNLNKMQTFFSDLSVKMTEIANKNINAPKRYKIGDIEFDLSEKELLERFIESDATLKELPLSLQRKMVKLLKENDNFLSDYFDNVMLSLGFKNVQGNADLNEFLKFYFKKAHKEGVDIETILERELGDFDYGILSGKINQMSGSLRAIYELAYENPNVNMNSWAVTIKNFLEATLPQIKRVENFWPWFKDFVPNWNGWKGAWTIKVELDNELKKLAQEIIEGENITGRMGTIFNKVMLLKNGTYGKEAATAFLDNELIGKGIFKGNPKFEKIINSVEYKELRNSLEEPLNNVLFAAIWSNIEPYLRMVLINRKWANVFGKEIPEAGKSKGKYLLDIFMESALPAINLILYADARTVTQLRQMDAYTGKYGKLIDKALTAIFWSYYLVPFIQAVGERTFIEDKVVVYQEDYEEMKKYFCLPDPKTNTKLGTDDFCKEIDAAINELKEIDTFDEVQDKIRSEVGFIPDVTHLFETKEFFNKYIGILTGGGGTKEAWKQFKGGFTKKLDDIEIETENRLGEFGYTGSTKQEKLKNATNNLIARVKEMERVNTIDNSVQGFKNWAAKNGYTVISDLNSNGIGKAKKNSPPGMENTNPEEEFEFTNGTFEP